MVIAPANTGRDRSKRITVILTAQTNKGIRSKIIPFARMFIIVVIKFKAPKIEDAPAKCKEKIARSTGGPECAIFLERGGYTVQPVPTPFSIIEDETSKNRAGGSSQNLILFSRGNAISGVESIRGNNQFPNPPINTGITKKKIIRKAWAVTIVLYSWSLSKSVPGWASSARIKSLIDVPKRPDQIPKIKYKVPISLWFVENSHRIN